LFKNLILKSLLITLCLYLFARATPLCPSKRAFFIDMYGQLVYIEKGWFDKKEGRWFTQEEADVRIEKYMKEHKQKYGR